MPSDVEILYGDPSRPGEPFVMRIRELPGTVIPPHSHPVDEHITVVSGTWYFALGDTWDPARLEPMEAGAYAFAPAGSVMYAHSPEAAVVQVHGVGPFDIHWLHGARTLDDPDANRAFAYGRGQRIVSERGAGTIRNGYASGDIVQYEIVGDDGLLYMALELDIRPE